MIFKHLDHIWRLFLLQTTRNSKTLDGLGFFFILSPLLRRQRDKGERAATGVRHLGYFNCNPYMAPYIAGAVVNLERRRISGEHVKPEMIERFKSTLSSVLTAKGDYFFHAVLLPLGLTIGSIFAMYESYIGLVVFIALYNIFHFQSRIGGYLTGVRLGEGVGGTLIAGLFRGQGVLGGCAAFVAGIFAALVMRRAYGMGGVPFAVWGVAAVALGLFLRKKFSFYWCVFIIFVATAIFLAAAGRP